ncbi:unnamed protein product [Clonostachys solani]|uniref:Uncharacterized protein n=1 Tax=Clonostachys solani TaxID=160281 RepID=A0A9N9ZPD8_9HYPO|nr:unnamed protein product [Clonostachys solani]
MALLRDPESLNSHTSISSSILFFIIQFKMEAKTRDRPIYKSCPTPRPEEQSFV